MSNSEEYIKLSDLMKWLYENAFVEPYDLLLKDKHKELPTYTIPEPDYEWSGEVPKFAEFENRGSHCVICGFPFEVGGQKVTIKIYKGQGE